MARRERYDNEMFDLDARAALGVECGHASTSCISGRPVHSQVSCTSRSEGTCQLVQHLPACNKWLLHNELQLRESTGKGGRLSLVACPSPFPSTCTADELYHRHQADVLLNRLLKTHRCIGEIDLLRFPHMSGAFDHTHKVLCDALSQNSSVRVLRMNFNHSQTHEDLCALLSSLDHIEQLECDHNGFCKAPLPATLTALLRTTRALTTLKIPELRFNETQAGEFLLALIGNGTLKELSIREYEPTSMHPSLLSRSAFGKFLKTTLTLNTLTITIPAPSCYSGIRNQWPRILEGLVGNTTIKNLSLESVMVDEECATLITKIFDQNKIIRTFHMTSKRERLFESRQTFDQFEAMSECWLRTLVENDTLENVRLCFDIWTMEQWARFFCALIKKEKMRTVEVTISDRALLPELCRMLSETGAEEVVSLGHCYIEERGIVECKAFSGMVARSGKLSKDKLCEILKLLPSLRHVKFLSLHINFTHLDAELSSDVGEYFAATTTLKELDLALRCDGSGVDAADNHLKTILESLPRNRSIKRLSVLASHLKREHIELLADVIKLSESIHTIQFNAENSRKRNSFVRRLSLNISENYQLLDASLSHTLERDKEAYEAWSTILEATRRNSGLLIRAASFVSGARRGRFSASALELVFRHTALPEEVSKQASLTETDAAALIRRAFERLQDLNEYMRLSGVVRHRVVCHPCLSARVQLDDLNQQCWYAVRRYLTLNDVKESSSTRLNNGQLPALSSAINTNDWP
ncbi:hypothetical protein HPB50_024339 [Hyalomma asiaticum]|uniref:Uncharacterized protein n=1 Tax=Hyalomma asiaticum TaxID=266040 RepID=A0ACB7TBR6_HYAAI|nr:hypothetical protein HPB50_024339 [Hyalomma asiaticum]